MNENELLNEITEVIETDPIEDSADADLLRDISDLMNDHSHVESENEEPHGEPEDEFSQDEFGEESEGHQALSDREIETRKRIAKGATNMAVNVNRLVGFGVSGWKDFLKYTPEQEMIDEFQNATEDWLMTLREINGSVLLVSMGMAFLAMIATTIPEALANRGIEESEGENDQNSNSIDWNEMNGFDSNVVTEVMPSDPSPSGEGEPDQENVDTASAAEEPEILKPHEHEFNRKSFSIDDNGMYRNDHNGIYIKKSLRTESMSDFVKSLKTGGYNSKGIQMELTEFKKRNEARPDSL